MTGTVVLDITAYNKVSSVQRSAIVESHYRELYDLEIVPYDDTICLFNLSSPAAEQARTCTLTLATSTNVDSWRNLVVQWYRKDGDTEIPLNGSHSEDGAPFLTFRHLNTRTYTYGATVRSVLDDVMFVPEMPIEIVPEVYFEGTQNQPKIILRDPSSEEKVQFYEQDCVEIRINIDKDKNQQNEISPVDFKVQYHGTDDVLQDRVF